MQYAKVFPSPYWGLFFYLSTFIVMMRSIIQTSFRPHIGDYFFIIILTQDQFAERLWFPSPYWGLFFYHGQVSSRMFHF